MGSFDVLSLDELTELSVARHRNLLPEKSVAQNGDNWKRLRVTDGGVAGLHAHILSVARDVMADTAGEATIERIGSIWGVTRKGASAASAASAGKILGTAGSSWTTADTLVHSSGLTFRPTADGTLDASGEALVGIIAIDTGSDTRLTAGEILTWQDGAPAGLENEVELQVDLDQGGADKEDIGAYRDRILNRIAQPAQGGNANDWEQWVLESLDSVASAYVWPNRNGMGSVDVAGLKAGSGSARLLDASEQADVLAYVNGVRPVTATARVLDVTAETLDVEVTLVPEPDAQFAKDWDDSAGYTVAAWTAATRTLQLSADRPAGMAVGQRLIVRGTSGVQLEIESLSGTDSVVLVSAKGETPTVGQDVYSGGPLIDDVRDGILALFDDLGPRVGTFGLGDWEGTLRLSKLFRAVQDTAGVLDSTIVSPAASTDPTAETYPDDATVNLLVPGNVLVRYAA